MKQKSLLPTNQIRHMNQHAKRQHAKFVEKNFPKTINLDAHMRNEHDFVYIVTNKQSGSRRETPQEKIPVRVSSQSNQCEVCSLSLESAGLVKAYMTQAHEKTECIP